MGTNYFENWSETMTTASEIYFILSNICSGHPICLLEVDISWKSISNTWMHHVSRSNALRFSKLGLQDFEHSWKQKGFSNNMVRRGTTEIFRDYVISTFMPCATQELSGTSLANLDLFTCKLRNKKRGEKLSGKHYHPQKQCTMYSMLLLMLEGIGYPLT